VPTGSTNSDSSSEQADRVEVVYSLATKSGAAISSHMISDVPVEGRPVILRSVNVRAVPQAGGYNLHQVTLYLEEPPTRTLVILEER
jgi:hypothetical protein